MRRTYIDNTKAIGILLVVVGHAAGTPGALISPIYSFHMPLFFFLSGMLLKDTKLQASPREFLATQIRTLILPYGFFWLLSYFYWLLTHRRPGLCSRRAAGSAVSSTATGG